QRRSPTPPVARRSTIESLPSLLLSSRGAYPSLDRLEQRPNVENAADPCLGAYELPHVLPASEIFGDGNVAARHPCVPFETIDAERGPILVPSAQEEPGWNVRGPRVPE